MKIAPAIVEIAELPLIGAHHIHMAGFALLVDSQTNPMPAFALNVDPISEPLTVRGLFINQIIALRNS